MQVKSEIGVQSQPINTWINPLLSWALHASFYAKRHIKEEQRMSRALRMRDEGRKLVCQDQHSARPAFS
ncbi:hypothetical protein Q8A67_016762 [Cirrhinus molitorella]|uniref:Uncharacterized protein n=1 Tax=Cirrhinus molitorella TaxID=172907 RepID=A0AA88PKP4_9TELE|nr:hypothetical protein Q8A67_016762 [Cirrhinus molitorella]